jgi:hypothetical protein
MPEQRLTFVWSETASTDHTKAGALDKSKKPMRSSVRKEVFQIEKDRRRTTQMNSLIPDSSAPHSVVSKIGLGLYLFQKPRRKICRPNERYSRTVVS